MSEKCTNCKLWRTSSTSNGLYSHNKLMGQGSPNPTIMFVGDWPEDEELKSKIPFTSLTGRMLKRTAIGVGIKEEDCFYTYLCKCKPSLEKPANKKDILACMVYLEEEIQKIKPKIIVAVGGAVSTALEIKSTITQNHGIPVFNERFNAWIVPIYHPKYVNNFVEQAKQRKEWVQDLGKIMRLANGTEEKTPSVEYKNIESLEDLKIMVDALLKSEWLAVDTETTGFDYFNDDIVMFSFSNGAGKGYAVPYKYPGKFAMDCLDEVKAEMNRLLDSPVKKIFQNGKFDLQFLIRAGIECKMFAFDTMLAHYLLDENSSHSLGNMAPTYTDMGSYKDGTVEYFKGKIKVSEGFDENGKETFRKCNIFDCPYDQLTYYAVQDADATFRLFEKFWPRLIEEDLLSLLIKVMVPLSSVLSRMEYTGIKGDLPYIETELQKFKTEIKELKHNIINSTQVKKYLEKYEGDEFNLNSPLQKSRLLFDIMELKPSKVNKLTDSQRAKGQKHGNPSTDAEALELLLKGNKIKLLEDIIHYGTVKKFAEYMLEYQRLLETSPDGRIHTSYNQSTTKTGRLSSSKPNLQNIPKHDPFKAKLIRSAFVARLGYSLLEIDYSQIEFKVWGHCSNDTVLLESLNAPGRDIHYRVAAQVYKLDVMQVTKAQRSTAKQVVYGLMYGRGAWSLAKEFGMTEVEVNRFVNGFFSAFPVAANWMEENIANMEKNGYLTNIMGRRRRATDIFSKDKGAKEAAKRQARNFPLQSGAADLIYKAMIKIYRTLLPYKGDADMLLQVHDSLVFEIKDELISTIVPQLKDCMENATNLKCKSTVDIEIGKNLGTMGPYEPEIYNDSGHKEEATSAN